MNVYPNDKEEPVTEDLNERHIPFDGFVNVNDIIRDRRRLKDNIDQEVPDLPGQNN